MVIGIPKTPDANTLKIFEDILSKNKINWTRRVSFGRDISGACGQLAGRNLSD